MDGTFDYDPNGQFVFLKAGEQILDMFTYTISDSRSGTDTATILITIHGLNDPPLAVDDSGFTGYENDILSFGNVMANDSDPDYDDLIMVGISGYDGLGVLDDHGDGTIYFNPGVDYDFLDKGEIRTESFTYTIMDDHFSEDTAVVSFTVVGENDNPIAVDDLGSGFSTYEKAPFTTASVLDNDIDLDEEDLIITNFNSNGALGVITNNGDGTFDYDPNNQFGYLEPGEYSTDTFIYTMTDGHGLLVTATVTITINGGNGPPSTVDDSGLGFETDQNTAFTTNNVLTNDSDPEGDTLFVASFDTTGTLGLVSDNGDGTFDYDPNGQFDGLISGDSGEDLFFYTVSDGNGGTDSGMVTITITYDDPYSYTYIPLIFK